MKTKYLAIVSVFFVVSAFKSHKTVDAQQGKNHAVFFAVKDYDHWPDLSNPIKNAKAISEILIEKYGFTTEILENPTRLEVKDKIRELKEQFYYPEDQLLIYFVGHGEFISSATDPKKGKGYFIPRDAVKNDKYCESYLYYPEVQPDIDDISCNHILVMVDACYSGSFLYSQAIGDRPGELSEREKLIRQSINKKCRVGITSGNLNIVKDGVSYSPFTLKFLTALHSYGGADRILTHNELFAEIETLPSEPRSGYFGSNNINSKFLFVAPPPKRVESNTSIKSPDIVNIPLVIIDTISNKGVYTDTRDQKSYHWRQMLDGKIWMTENLNFFTENSWCYFNTDVNCQKYGRLYTWEAANTACPDGWHLPSFDEWDTLIKNYGGVNNAYKHLADGESNISSFSVVLGGIRYKTTRFLFENEYGGYWSATNTTEKTAWGYYFDSTLKITNREYKYDQLTAFSCRCVKD